MIKAIQRARAKLTSWWPQWCASVKASPFFVTTLLGAGVVALADQATKIWVINVLRLIERRQIELTSIFDFTYVENRGASFGMLSGGMASRITLSVFAVVIIIGMIIWLGEVRRKLVAVGIVFIIGGALGNLIDRLLYGYVIDFIDFSAISFPWVFNLADSAINIGVACLLLDAFTSGDKVNNKQTRP